MIEARTHLINAPVGEAWHYFRIADKPETITIGHRIRETAGRPPGRPAVVAVVITLR